MKPRNIFRKERIELMPEFHISIEIANLMPHDLKLKNNVMILLMHD